MREWALRPLSGRLAITDPELNTGRNSFTTGSFIITLSAIGQDAPGGYAGPRLTIAHRSAPGRWLWHTLRGETFVGAAEGLETVTETRGSYFFSDRLVSTCADQTIDGIDQLPSAVEVRGSLTCSDGKIIGYTLIFHAPASNQLAFSLSFGHPKLNRAYLTYASDSDEHFFGLGEQFSRFDHKGQRVPIWVSEQGIGRGAQPVTALVNLAARSGGSDTTTYAAVPHYITSRLRSLFLENSEYSVFDLRAADRVQISTFSGQMQGRILFGANPEELITEYTGWAGRMRPLPNWILEGAVVGMQGGDARVREVYAQLKSRGTPVSAFWLQDWVGQRSTSFGKQLWWNWELDRERYPDWDALRAELAADDVRLMVYVSPFIADVAALKPNLRRNLFLEASQAGYLVKGADGSPYLIQNTDFSAGLLDLT
ncbi:MAG: alpha-glucosidase, partial [Chloroflexi bacterium]